MTDAQLTAQIREGARRALYFTKLLKSDFDGWTLKKLLSELKISLGDVVPSESHRILHLNISILKQVANAGFRMTPPTTKWYLANETQKTGAIADKIRSSGIETL